MKLRVYFDGGHTLGPGKVALLEAVREHGSISAAARSMDMAYRHAWELIHDLNECFRAPVVATAAGGRAGGGARLTPLGDEIVRRFRAMERRTRRTIAPDLAAFEARRRPAARAGAGKGRSRRAPRKR